MGKPFLAISSMSCMTCMMLQSELNMAIQSTSVMLGATNDCNLEAQILGHPAYNTYQLECDLAVPGYTMANHEQRC